MNLRELKKNSGVRVQLQPTAIRLDENGLELPTIDDDWTIVAVGENTINLSNIRSSHIATLGNDHVHHYTTNPGRSQSEMKFGFLTLHVQIYLQRENLWIRPTLRPGERLAPPMVTVAERVVDFSYPTDSGLQQRLEAEGYKLSWCLESRLTRATELNGYMVVIDKDGDGNLLSYRCKDPRDDQILVKKRN